MSDISDILIHSPQIKKEVKGKEYKLGKIDHSLLSYEEKRMMALQTIIKFLKVANYKVINCRDNDFQLITTLAQVANSVSIIRDAYQGEDTERFHQLVDDIVEYSSTFNEEYPKKNRNYLQKVQFTEELREKVYSLMQMLFKEEKLLS